MKAISLIVPVYNVAPWLPTCLESIAAQTFSDYQLILVDDGSTDESGCLCDEWKEAHPDTVVIHQENRGLSGARNSGLEKAEGEFIAFVDSDDTISPDYLERLYHACKQSDADIAICSVEDVNEDGSSQSPAVFTRPVQAGVFPGTELIGQFYIEDGTYYTVAWNKLYRAGLWKELRYPQGKIHEDDAVAHYLYCDSQRVVCLDEPLYQYRLRSGSICRSQLKSSAFDGVEALADRYFYLNGHREISPTVKSNALAACWRRYLSLCSQVKAQTTPELLERLKKIQPILRGMLVHLPACRALSFQEKLSAARWATMSPEKLCHL